MIDDPRLRLLGNQKADDLEQVDGRESPALAILRRLDETEVVVTVAPDADDAALIAVAAFVTMAARLVPHVVVTSTRELPTNWWQATSWADLLDRLTLVRPPADTPATRRIAVGFGVTTLGHDVYVGGGDWNVTIADAPVALETGNDHGLGIHAASCLAVSQVLIKTLGDLGFPGVEVSGIVETNLIDHRLHTLDKPDLASVTADAVALTGFLGVGSVGTSALALLATVCSPVLNATSAQAPRLAAALEVTAVDKDDFDPTRNPYRYPALLGGETGAKATTMVERLTELGLRATPVATDVATWNTAKSEPGWHGVIVSSVDTIPGRLDVTDILGEQTLSAGVSGTELHVQWERFADGYACPFCDFVRADPPLTQAGVYANVTGIAVARVLALLQGGARLGASDVDMAVAAGRVPAHRRDVLVGAPISDLIRQAYAEAEVRGPQGAEPDTTSNDVIAVASPQVSWFAGVLVAAELVKHMLGLPTLSRRVDLDVAGLPAGVVRIVPADTTGTCVCHSGVRRRWYRRLYDPPQPPPSVVVSETRRDGLQSSPVLTGAAPILEL